MSETATDILDRIERNRREQDYCYAVLDLWARVQNQGIEIASVESFGLDTRLFHPAKRPGSQGPPLSAGRSFCRASAHWRPPAEGLQLRPPP